MSQPEPIIPPVPRGEDRRQQPREGQDWRLPPRSHEFLGVEFDPLSFRDALARCKWVTAQHGFRYIATPNVDHMVRLTKEPEIFKPLYEASWLCVCDSRILEVLAALSRKPLKAVPGSDLTLHLFETEITADDTINVIGGDKDMIKVLKARYNLECVNHHEPPMGMRHKPEAIEAAAQFIADNPARYTFICVGSPQQEMVAKAALERGDCVGLGLCVGASLDFITGRAKRAPIWMQKSRLEWLYRLLSEPKRMWKRYLIEGPKIFWIWLKWRFSH